MDDPGRAIAEMARVCRPDGSLTLIDLIDGGARHDELERLRDPSHTHALTAAEMRSHLEAAGRPPARSAEREQPLPVGPWLDQAHTPPAAREQIEAALEAEADGGSATGLRSCRHEGTLAIVHTWLLLGA
jgi:hypothetical protein